MTGNRLLDFFVFALVSFLFYSVRYRKEKNDNPSSFDKSYDTYKMIRSLSPIIMFFILAIFSLLLWLGE